MSIVAKITYMFYLCNTRVGVGKCHFVEEGINCIVVTYFVLGLYLIFENLRWLPSYWLYRNFRTLCDLCIVNQGVSENRLVHLM